MNRGAKELSPGESDPVTNKSMVIIMVCGCLCAHVGVVLAASTGPTIHLTEGPDAILNPAANLMYLVPLVSPTMVENLSSNNNQQISKVLSMKRNFNKNDFRIVCEFDLQGTGSFTNSYEPNSLIAFWLPTNKPGKPMTNLLDYIKLEGSGFGSVEVTGRTVKGQREVTTVSIHFNGRGSKSPVSIGLYDLPFRNGRYDYANRCEQMIARVNTLTFRKTDPKEKPTMLVEVASVVGAQEAEGFWGNLKGALANLFVPPIEVDKDGNDAILEFGSAMVNGQASFTFPKAKNLIEQPQLAENDQATAKATALAPELGS